MGHRNLELEEAQRGTQGSALGLHWQELRLEMGSNFHDLGKDCFYKYLSSKCHFPHEHLDMLRNEVRDCARFATESQAPRRPPRTQWIPNKYFLNECRNV